MHRKMPVSVIIHHCPLTSRASHNESALMVGFLSYLLQTNPPLFHLPPLDELYFGAYNKI